MPITIGTNISSLRAQRQLDKSSDALSKSFERLASGERINRASDDAAGLAVAMSLRSDRRIYTQAARNVNDGISALSIADGALTEAGGILTRMQELVEQAANGIYGSTQRTAMDNEIQSLRAEYNRIFATTTFNGRRLFSTNSNEQTIALQVGVDSSSNARISLSLGNNLRRSVGDGTFAAPISEPTEAGGTRSHTVLTGDLTGDGYDDVVVGTYDGGAVYNTVLVSNGNGTFKKNLLSPIMLRGAGSAMSDFNADGKVDLVFATDSNFGVVYFQGNGDGTFKAGVTAASFSSAANGITVADFNADGKVDVAATQENGAGNDTVNILLGNGNGTFLAPATYSVVSTGQPFGIKAQDLSSDGVTDLIVASTNSGGALSILIGNSNGTFKASSTLYSGTPSDVEIYDINGDGKNDLAFTEVASAQLLISLGNGNGTFQSPITFSGPSNNAPNSVVLGDINDDGLVDAITSGNQTASNIFLGNGNGTFKTSTALAASSFGSSFTSQATSLSDLNGDEVLDLVFANRSAVNIGIAYGNYSTSYNLKALSVLTSVSRNTAFSTLETAQQRIRDERSAIGAAQSRLNISMATLSTSAIETAAAESRISDVDVAETSAQATRLEILRNTSSAVLAQANQQPALALKLLVG